MIELIRNNDYRSDGTFGQLIVGDLKLATVERPWLDNQRKISCIPEGDYPIKLGRYHHGGYDAYEILNVPDRSEIKIHIANWPHELAGCIAPGMEHSSDGVRQSRKAFTLFMAIMAELACESIQISRAD